ncbi:MAG: HAMP domain-containing protein [Actinobacteria bacterium]|nr:HAMP domain-containing protein [Actinomycetota bacterium]
MTRRLVLAMTVLVAVVAAALAIPLAIVVANDQRAAFVSSLEVDTLAAASLLSSQPVFDWQGTAVDTAQRTGARVVVVDSQRNLIADSDNSSLDRLFDRPEINSALAGALTSDVRYSSTIGGDLRYVAAPVVQNYAVDAAVRLSLPEASVNEQVQRTARWLVLFVVSVVITAALVAWLLARSIASPLRRLARVASDLPEDLALRADAGHGPGEVRAVARALNSTADRLSGILQRTQRVAADASHHLRTPLTGVRLRLEAIEDISDDSRVQSEARAATAEVDRLNHRIDQVLALARSDAGVAPVEAQDASHVVRDRVAAASAMFVEKDVALTESIDEAVFVAAPTGVIARIVDELLGNALQYAKGRVHVTLRQTTGDAMLSVADDGLGVPRGERDAVFDRFTRGSTSVPGGSGLGLALVRESVTGIGGSAKATESRWGGSRRDGAHSFGRAGQVHPDAWLSEWIRVLTSPSSAVASSGSPWRMPGSHVTRPRVSWCTTRRTTLARTRRVVTAESCMRGSTTRPTR